MVTVVNNNVLIYLTFAKTVDMKCSGYSLSIHAYVLLRGLKKKEPSPDSQNKFLLVMRTVSGLMYLLPQPAQTSVLSCCSPMVLAGEP